jgi:general secretion pathway protein D
MNPLPTRRLLLLLALALLLAGCAAADRMQREGLELIDQGRVEEGLSKLEDAVRESPDKSQYRITLETQRERIVARVLAAADRALGADNAEQAETFYRRVLAIEPRNERALAGLRALEKRKQVNDLVSQGQDALRKGDLDTAARLEESALTINPRHGGAIKLRSQIQDARLKELTAYPALKSKLSKPVSLEFRDANLKMVFDVLARTSGINFVFDKDVRSDLKATIFVKKVAVEDAIELLLLQSQLEKRVINENTLLVYPNTPQKAKDYQDLVIKNFYLANADAKQTLNMIKTILKTKDVFVDEKLNLLVMRDTPDAIRIAEKLIAAQDVAEPEVVLEVEVLEVVGTTDTNLGLQGPEAIDFTVTTRDNYHINGPASINGTLNLRDRSGDTNILANPRIRVKNREKAKINIVDRIPLVSSTVSPTTTTGTTGSGTTPTSVVNTNNSLIVSQTVTYVDVGLKLDVEPIIHLDDEVAIKLNLEVSTAGQLTTTTAGTTTLQVNTRNAATVLQLKDGETATLMGLIRDDEIRAVQKIPGLGEIPILGRLFSNHNKQTTKTQIVLSITPRIVRNLRQEMPTITEYVSGSEGSIKASLPGQRPVSEADAVSLRGSGAPAPAPAARPAPPAPAPAAPENESAAPGSQAVTLSVQGPSAANVGQEFLVTLQAQADQPLVSTAVQLSYDASALRVVEVTEGDLLKQEGGQTNFSNKVDPSSGKIFVGLSRAGATGVTGQGSLVTIKFAATAEKPNALVQVPVFSGVGVGNKLLPATLPGPLDIKIGS